jgi:hypothetical protein
MEIFCVKFLGGDEKATRFLEDSPGRGWVNSSIPSVFVQI